jgi:hypothetical protein
VRLETNKKDVQSHLPHARALLNLLPHPLPFRLRISRAPLQNHKNTVATTPGLTSSDFADFLTRSFASKSESDDSDPESAIKGQRPPPRFFVATGDTLLSPPLLLTTRSYLSSAAIAPQPATRDRMENFLIRLRIQGTLPNPICGKT